jgi:hypothetical protein
MQRKVVVYESMIIEGTPLTTTVIPKGKNGNLNATFGRAYGRNAPMIIDTPPNIDIVSIRH